MPIRIASLTKRIARNGAMLSKATKDRVLSLGADHEPSEAEQALAEAFQVRSIPTVAIFRDGIMLGAQPGALPADALDEIIRQVRTLDMDAVRREIAEAEQKLAEEPRIITP